MKQRLYACSLIAPNTHARLASVDDPVDQIEFLILHNPALDWSDGDDKQDPFAAFARRYGLVDPKHLNAADVIDSLLQVGLWVRSCQTTRVESHRTLEAIACAIHTAPFNFRSVGEMGEFFQRIALPFITSEDERPKTWRVYRVVEDEGGMGEEGAPIALRDDFRQRMTEGLPDQQAFEKRPVKEFEHFIKTTQDPDLPVKLRRYVKAGCSIDLYKRLGRRSDRAAGRDRPEWVVEGLIPAGSVTLIPADRETGKSTLVTQLAVDIALGRETFLSQRINPKFAKGVVVLLTGEDTEKLVNARLEFLDPGDQAEIVLYALDGRSIAEIIDEIADISNLAAVVIDPARRYIEGDEDGSGPVDAFFALLDALAQKTGAAVLVTHHLRRGASPTSLAGVRDAIRGSGVFLDRPRTVIAMLRRGDVTMIGVVKNNLPPDYPIIEKLKLRRDPKTLRHVPINDDNDPVNSDETPVVNSDQSDDELEHRVLNAVQELFNERVPITRSGDHQLWGLHSLHLEGFSRARVRAAIDRLIKDDILIFDDKLGLKTVS